MPRVINKNKIGSTSTSGNQIQVAFRTGGTSYTGWIVKQKGSRRFVCTNGTVTETCVLVNAASESLNNGEMNISATKEDTTTFYVKRLTSRKVTDYSDNPFMWNNVSNSASASTLPYQTVSLSMA